MVDMHAMKPFLITGGTGKTGRRIVERLEKAGYPVRIGGRSVAPGFDWNAPETWGPVLEGVGAVYIAYHPDLAAPGAPDTVRAFADQALAAGVTRMVLLSGRGEEEAQRAETLLQNSGADLTIIRASWFFQNFSENFFLDAILSGEVALPDNGVLEPFVDADDLADIAFAALTDPAHIGQLYEVTGSRLINFADALAEISTASGRPIRYTPISAEDYTAGLRALDLPEDLVWLVTYLFGTVLDGRNAYVTDGVRRALGREPRDFSDYVRETAATGVWGTTT